MSTIKVDTITTRTGSGNITLSNNAVLSGNIQKTGDLTLDVSGDIILDADGADVKLSDNGTVYGELTNAASYLRIKNPIQDQDIEFVGNDGGSAITALRFDMSDAGRAVFNAGVSLGGNDAAHTLDDYEEGTWTPQLRGGGTNVGTTVLQAFYTKIGNVVHCEFNIQRNDSATNNNNMEMTGLPFPHRTIPSTVGQAWIDNTSGDHKCFIYLPSDSSKIYFVKAGANDSYVNMNEYDNGRYVYAAFTDMTDS